MAEKNHDQELDNSCSILTHISSLLGKIKTLQSSSNVSQETLINSQVSTQLIHSKILSCIEGLLQYEIKNISSKRESENMPAP